MTSMINCELPTYACVTNDVQLGKRVRLGSFINLYGCEIGDDTRVGAFVEVQRGARIGKRCKISSHSFICTGVEIEDDVFIGHGVIFINDRHPRATGTGGLPVTDGEWHLEPIIVKRGASIGSGAVVMCGVVIGESATVGAGALVTRNVQENSLVVGNPARVRKGYAATRGRIRL
jgi:acetyltransferase-like isoleucine patch superfamily enzyme